MRNLLAQIFLTPQDVFRGTLFFNKAIKKATEESSVAFLIESSH